MNANQPMFIYVESDDKYAKFWLKPVQLAKSVGYSAKELNENISVAAIFK